MAPRGVDYEPAALARLLAASGGYPYFLQEYGRAAWEVATGPTITVADAEAAAVLGPERLDAGFSRARWNRATAAERRMLAAMAADGAGPSSSTSVASRMGLRPSSLGPYRARLIAKGLVYSPDHGLVAYTVPGMDAYVARHVEEVQDE